MYVVQKIKTCQLYGIRLDADVLFQETEQFVRNLHSTSFGCGCGLGFRVGLGRQLFDDILLNGMDQYS